MDYLYGIWAVILIGFAYQVADGERIKQKGTPTGVLSWDKYYSAAEISIFTKALAAKNNHVKRLSLGRTYERRPLQALVFSDGSERKEATERLKEMELEDAVIQKPFDTKQKIKDRRIKNKVEKPVIMIEAGAHAREWLSPAVATYIAQQLAQPENAYLLKNVTWVVVPLLNPDGYDYSRTPNNRYWRKNRRYNKEDPSCPGVDLNRNFKKGWNTTGSSTYLCSDLYHGKRPFSEKESRAMRKLLNKFTNVKLYLALHSYGQVILYPWGYTSKEPSDLSKLKNMADAFSRHISEYNGERVYDVDQAGRGYQAGGGSDDYAYSRGVPYSFTFELPPTWGRSRFGGFVMPPEKILGISQEVWTGLRKLFGDLFPENC